MNTEWQTIAQALREELAEYGELLRLFEAQQASIFERDPDTVLQLAHEIEVQARCLGACRGRREFVVGEFAAAQGRPANSPLRALLPWIAEEARPLLEALIKEVNVLLHRVRRTSRHNHALLSRTVELHQDTLLQLQPQAFSKTYSPSGRVAMTSNQPSLTLHTAG